MVSWENFLADTGIGPAQGTHGFTDEELDFIINCDIKYRMGRDGEGAEEERE